LRCNFCKTTYLSGKGINGGVIMAVYRQVQVSFWTDDFVLDLTPEEKYFYMYLMTCARSSQCGIYNLSMKIIEFETGFNIDTVDKLIKRFIDYGKILYNYETKEIMILNWIRYNFINSRNTITCINKELSKIKCKGFIKKLYEICSTNSYPLEVIFAGINFEDEVCHKPEASIKKIVRGFEGVSYTLGEEKEEIKEKEETEEEVKIKAEEEEKVAEAGMKSKKVIDAFSCRSQNRASMEERRFKNWHSYVEPDTGILTPNEEIVCNVSSA
jgi:hypothetical protein